MCPAIVDFDHAITMQKRKNSKTVVRLISRVMVASDDMGGDLDVIEELFYVKDACRRRFTFVEDITEEHHTITVLSVSVLVENLCCL